MTRFHFVFSFTCFLLVKFVFKMAGFNFAWNNISLLCQKCNKVRTCHLEHNFNSAGTGEAKHEAKASCLCFVTVKSTNTGREMNTHSLCQADLILFVLSGVRKTRDNCRDTGSRCNLAGIDHNQQLHQVIIDVSTSTLYDVNIFTAYTLADLNTERF